GFFITPALMGGPGDVMIAMLIEREVEITLNWSFASALAVILLALTLVGFVGYNRIVRLERVFDGRGGWGRPGSGTGPARWASWASRGGAGGGGGGEGARPRSAGLVARGGRRPRLPDRPGGDHPNGLVLRRGVLGLPPAVPLAPLVPALPRDGELARRHRG